MRRNIGKVLALAALTGIGAAGSPRARAQQSRAAAPPPRAASQPAPKAAAAPADPAKVERMKQLLRAWEGQSTKLKVLIVQLKRKDKTPAWDDEEYEGTAIFKSPNLAWINFKKYEVGEDGKKRLMPYEQIRCTGTEVWQYKSDNKQVFVFPLAKKDQRHALEEGPLPFLFNMRAAEAENRYAMELVGEDDKVFTIQVIPRLEIDRENFMEAYIQLERKYLLPSRIVLFGPDRKSKKDFVIVESKANPAQEIPAAYFQGEIPKPPWKVVRNPNPNGGGKVPDEPAAPAREPRPALRSGLPAGRR